MHDNNNTCSTSGDFCCPTSLACDSKVGGFCRQLISSVPSMKSSDAKEQKKLMHVTFGTRSPDNKTSERGGYSR